jgi:hypothetical protein
MNDGQYIFIGPSPKVYSTKGLHRPTKKKATVSTEIKLSVRYIRQQNNITKFQLPICSSSAWTCAHASVRRTPLSHQLPPASLPVTAKVFLNDRSECRTPLTYHGFPRAFARLFRSFPGVVTAEEKSNPYIPALCQFEEDSSNIPGSPINAR